MNEENMVVTNLAFKATVQQTADFWAACAWLGVSPAEWFLGHAVDLVAEHKEKTRPKKRGKKKGGK